MLSSGVLLPDSIFMRHRDQHVKQAKLRHGARDGAEKNSDRRCKEQIDHGAGDEQRDRPGDGNAEQPAYDDIQREADRNRDHQGIRPDLGHGDLERR